MEAPTRYTQLFRPVMSGVRRQKTLTGQKALVTGASSPMGQAIALALGEAGADVVVNYLSGEDEAQCLVEKLRAKGVRAMAVRADVSDDGQVREMFWNVVDELGTIDLLVNNAELELQQTAALQELTPAQWEKAIAVDLTGQFLCSREAVREFMRRGVKQDVSCSAGKIISISFVHEVIRRTGHVNYASNGGVKLMMENLAQEVAPYRIRVNSICAGAIRTREVGHATVWLASDEADHVHGVSLFVDGGMVL